jgi:predicted secreted protein
MATLPNAYRALGTKFKKGAVTIGGLKEINGVDMSADTIDVTTLDSTGGYRSFLAGFKDGGEMTISGFFVPGDVGQAALTTAFYSGDTDVYSIEFPAALGASWVISGVVTKFTTKAAVEDAIGFDCTVKVSGQPNLGLTASTGASAITVTAADGTTPLTAVEFTPAFTTAGKYYSVTYTTETSFGVKVTAASHTIHMYVDGVYNSELTSGTVSSAITNAAATAKELKIMCYEVGKTPIVYTFIVSRIS